MPEESPVQPAVSDIERTARHNRLQRFDYAGAYQTNLPIHDHRDDIVRAIRDHQVIIVAGETGSGKTTQLPLLSLEAGRGVHGRIGATQPRRLAAVSLAQYVAQRTGTPAGELVGYTVRFNDQIAFGTPIKFMTDGILLAEIQSDRLLNQYDTIILDEVHERSVNIDFILGYLRTLLPKRPDLRVIIASATLDVKLFSRTFNHAPIVTVSGRMFPVDIRYRPPIELWRGEHLDSYIEGAVASVRELVSENPPGDILVFMPTVQDIQDTLTRLSPVAQENGRALLPLHSRLPYDQQRRIFERGLKIVVATNIAETSITVPGVRYVIDSGLARTVRYEPGSSLSRMPIEKISRAAADQRAGRCGRVRNGICIRLYAEQDYHSRPPYTTPEIKRTNLASAALRMTSLRLGKPERFPFVQRPPKAALDAGYRQLRNLGALDRHGRLTQLGRRMARFPLDPSLSRMLLYAHEHGVLEAVTVIAAALSLDALFVHHSEQSTEAAAKLRRFKDRKSDFISFVSLWKALHNGSRAHPGNKTLHAFCRRHGLSPLRVREWIDIYKQIQRACRRAGFTAQPRGGGYDAIHKSLMTGLIEHIARRQDNGLYAAAYAHDIAPFPSSALFRGQHRWVLFNEIVETKRMYGRIGAAIEPRWLEELFRDHIRYEYDNPRFDQSCGTVVAERQAFFHGLSLNTTRTIDFADIDRDAAHEIFIDEALVRERIGDAFRFIRRNREVRETIALAQRKLRTSRLYGGDCALRQFYEERLEGVARIDELCRVIKARGDDSFLCAPAEALLASPIPPSLNRYPDTIIAGTQRLTIRYELAPDQPADGATIIVPLDVYAQTPPYYWEWLPPVFREQRIERVLKLLANHLGIDQADTDELVTMIHRALRVATEPFLHALAREIHERFGANLDAGALGQICAVTHLWARVVLVDAEGFSLGSFRPPFESAPVAHQPVLRPGPLWTAMVSSNAHGAANLESSLREIELGASGQKTPLAAITALVYENNLPALRLFFSRAAAQTAHAETVRRMIEERLDEPMAWESRHLRIKPELQRRFQAVCSPDELNQTAYRLFHETLVNADYCAIRNRDQFARTVDAAAARVPGTSDRVVTIIERCLEAYECCFGVLEKKAGKHSGSLFDSIADSLYGTLDRYLCDFFDSATPAARLENTPRYLAALTGQIESAFAAPGRYRQRLREIKKWRVRLDSLCRRPSWRWYSCRTAYHDLQMLFEEYLVTLFGEQKGIKPACQASLAAITGRYERVKGQFDACERREPPSRRPYTPHISV